MKNNHYDVIIIGAGPAGASCANELVKNGVKTLVIEKKKMPRNKCCAGFLTERAFQFVESNFNKIPDNLYCKSKQLQIGISKRGKHFYILSDIFKNLKRAYFDHWLIKCSKVKILEGCSFITADIQNNSINIQCKLNDNTDQIFQCKYLIGADGANSKVRKLIDNSYNNKNNFTIIQKIYKGIFNIDDEHYYLAYSKKFTNDCFAFYLKKDDLYYIGTGWSGKNNNYLNKWFDFLKEQHNFELKHIRTECCLMEKFLNGNNYFFGRNRILICGEAGGLINPYGEGISSALISGKYIAESLIKNFKNALPIYEDKIQQEISFLKTQAINSKIF